jgi:hypothetical protein
MSDDDPEIGAPAVLRAALRQNFTVKIINPFGVLGIPTDGFNALALLDEERHAHCAKDVMQ